MKNLRMIDDVGEITAHAIYEFFRQEQTIDLINKLKQAGDNMKAETKKSSTGKLAGKTFCVNWNLGALFKR